MGDAMGNCARLACSGPGEHTDGAARSGDGGTLLVIETIEKRARHPAILSATADNTPPPPRC